MISKELKTIIDMLAGQGKMFFLEGATDEQIIQFEIDYETELPKNTKSGCNIQMVGSYFFQQEFNYMVSHISRSSI